MRRAFGLLAAAWLLALAPAASAASSKDLAEGRRHLHKANALAADAKCDAAVREYSFAYQKLHDPVVLFNRAECYRRLGQNDAAISDYRAFLEAVPRAPNRAEVEARLTALEGGPPPIVTPPPARPAPPATRPVLPSVPAQAVAPPAAPAAVSPVLTAPEAVPAAEPETPAVSVTAAPAVAAEPADSASHGRLWLWAAIGAAVAGGAVGAYVALRSPGVSPPSTQLGNYKF